MKWDEFFIHENTDITIYFRFLSESWDGRFRYWSMGDLQTLLSSHLNTNLFLFCFFAAPVQQGMLWYCISVSACLTVVDVPLPSMSQTQQENKTGYTLIPAALSKFIDPLRTITVTLLPNEKSVISSFSVTQKFAKCCKNVWKRVHNLWFSH